MVLNTNMKKSEIENNQENFSNIETLGSGLEKNKVSAFFCSREYACGVLILAKSDTVHLKLFIVMGFHIHFSGDVCQFQYVYLSFNNDILKIMKIIQEDENTLEC